MQQDHCSVDGCDRPTYGRQRECEAHYRRRRRTGRVSAHRAIGMPVEPMQCAVEGCDNTATERSLCHGHYLRAVRSGDVDAHRALGRRINFSCAVDSCDRPAVNRGLCRTHANRKRKYGDVQADKPIRDIAGLGYINHGYRVIPVPPELRHLVNGETAAFEHRFAMARLLGRPLLPTESVHHINGDRLDNRTDGPLQNFRSGNLELWSRWQPSGQRIVDKVAYAIELLERYLPDALTPQIPLHLPELDPWKLE